ncbi:MULTISPECIES: glucose-6-phosphate isomerase [unclassified Undibacterium]|uniref:glucose-6-phosphate isomerase n=1 Tax=unclassified Undibacterium TaxID=2630295 RepID=UPI002AC999B8|nr:MULTISPECIES: glucose-6-phosphate isomerase [unclassified Undibacterium]MEB0139176.1 glucose-6-phosphate isomerase [Undibacterium sp. CCC2.1]MEB0172249.1 glucose-6-phosphate isomerase [Undibacterium sp. CCC1.1]MEB0175894.1 glucose-6-phosphate isomerase [Undibacterium sp. CCC3.4]MEB0215246.1 glucose-6-phosphate isomerase [Undibacterium sp. 5I2]WPX43544.1 glucose-6-phosphate isomerase [Undibacterium sp. CCC3.4]
MATSVSRTPLWCLLQQRATNMPGLKELFRADAQRFTRFSASACGILLDYSKQRIDTTAKLNLLALARQQEVEARRDAMLRGEAINHTENRAVLHTVLRLPKDESFVLNGENIAADVHAVLAQMRNFSDAVREGRWLGFTGKAIRTIVNIGIGGSDLGPQMACIALAPWSQKNLSLHFVSNVDGRHVADALANADPETTLFVVASKTFTTMETLTNARTARDWMLAHGCPLDQIRQHFVALSTNVKAAGEFGIAEENVFPFWNWAGGRYSMWSAIGLSIALYVGADRFEEMLAGAHEMDLHFAQAPLEQNLPVLMALVGIWNINFLGLQALSIAPYHQRMTRLPAYLQQLEMESNGKSVTREGERVDYPTSPILFGEAGTNGQHAYFQLLHQGATIIPTDFIVVADDDAGLPGHNQALLANCFAQSKAMALGKNIDEVRAELGDLPEKMLAPRVFEGNRPTSTVLLDELTPRSLGALIALYEHKVFVQSVIWDINAFDQWGVELGKSLAQQLISLDPAAVKEEYDSSTRGLLLAVKRSQQFKKAA